MDPLCDRLSLSGAERLDLKKSNPTRLCERNDSWEDRSCTLPCDPLKQLARMSSAIRCSNLVKTYDGKPPVEALRGVDLEVEQGECFGVLGPNGAGKTTLIEILEGLLTATGGDVEVLGMDWSKQGNAIRQQIGVSLQETQLSEKMSVLETLTLFRSFYARGIEPEAAIQRVSLQEKRHAWVKNLSGGQKQRLAVATAPGRRPATAVSG